ncbi:MAG: tetratricopeptide repeat protein [Pseudomonadota bacterium]
MDFTATAKKLACAALLLIVTSKAVAQQLDPNVYPPASEADAYRAMLADPSNPDLTASAAQQLEKRGSYPDAIRLYHRLLQMVGNDPNIRLRIALLEYRLGNFPAALTQVQLAELADLPPDSATVADRLRTELQKRQSRHQFDGQIRTGWRYRSNANYAPDDFPLVLGSEFETSPIRIENSVPTFDNSLFSELQLAHIYDPQVQEGTTIETYLAVGGEKQIRLDQFDRIALSIASGPRFQMDPSRPGWASVRPAFTLDVLNFQGEFYSVTPGLLLEFDHRPASRISLNASLAAQWRFHGSAADVRFVGNTLPPDAVVTLPVREGEDRNGLSLFGTAGVEWSPTLMTLLSGTVFAEYHDSADDAVSRAVTGVEMSGTLFFDIDGKLPAASLAATGGYAFAAYRDADTQVTRNPGFVHPEIFTRTRPNQKRLDHEFYLGLEGELPLTHDLFLTAGVLYETTFGTVPNYQFENFTFGLSVGWEF